MEHRDTYQLAYNLIDFLLWKEWDPIGGGVLSVPRDEYSSYTADIVNAKIAGKSILEIEKILSGFVKSRMGISDNPEHSRKIATRIFTLNISGKINPMDLNYYVERHEEQLNWLFLLRGFPTSYYFFEQNSLVPTQRAIKKSDIHPIDIFMGRWSEIVLMGHPWINIAPQGYWEQAFVFCVEFSNGNINSTPVGMGTIMTPGLPFGLDGKPKTNLIENIDVLED